MVKGKDFAGEIPDDIVVRIHNTVPTALIDLATGSVTKHPYQLPKAIQAKKLTPESHTAILVPQRLESKRPLIEVITREYLTWWKAGFTLKRELSIQFR